MHVHCPHIFLM